MLSACGSEPVTKSAERPPPINLNDPGAVAEASVVQREEYNSSTIYKGPNLAKNPQGQLFIRAVKADGGNVDDQIYVEIHYAVVWRFYNSAYDEMGKPMDITVLTRNVNQCKRDDCPQSEYLIIDVTWKYLKEHMDSGLHFWLTGKKENSKEAFFIPPGYIKAFLSLSN